MDGNSVHLDPIEEAVLPLTGETRCAVVALYAATFQQPVEDNVRHLEEARGSVCWIARSEGALLGFKWGNERRPREFHSALGAVLPSHQRQGVGRALLRHQHGWARARGYPKITTNTYHRFLPMLLLNLREGFELVGVRQSGSGLKLLLEKAFDAPASSAEQGFRPGAQEALGRVALIEALQQGYEVIGLRTLDASPVVLLGR